MGGHLATITSAAETAFIVEHLPTAIENADGVFEGGAYIGAHQPGGGDGTADGGWEWVTGEAWSYTNWSSGEPNNSCGPNCGEDYAHFWHSGPQPTPEESFVWDGHWNDVTNLVKGFVVEYEPDGGGSIEADIDVKPGSNTNPINPRGKGVIPVAVLTTDDFDATTIDASTVLFGPDGASEAHNKAHLEDVDRDGDTDMVLHFRTQDTGIQQRDTEACLSGLTKDGDALEGCDSIKTVGR